MNRESFRHVLPWGTLLAGFLFSLFPVFVLAVEFADLTEFAEFEFRPDSPRSGTGMRVEQIGPNAVRFAMTSAAEFGSESVYARFEHESMAQQKLVFRVKGKPGNGGAFLAPILNVREGDRTRRVVGPNIAVNGDDFHRYVLGLDTDFQLGDGRWLITRLEFSFNSAREPLNQEFVVEIDKIRFVNSENVVSRKKTPIVVCREKKSEAGLKLGENKNENKSGSDGGSNDVLSSLHAKEISVFFDFDNNDFADSVARDGRHAAELPDCPGDFSYRKLLLENCPLFTLAESPEEADVLVSQRTTPSPLAERIASLVRDGKPLLIYGAIPDPRLEELSPLALSRIAQDAFAPREKIVAAGGPETFYRKIPIQDCAVGRYFDAKLRENAECLLKFEKSAIPYLARKGNVLHVAGTSGQTLVSSRVFYDKLALILCAHLGKNGNALEILDFLERRVPPRKVFKENGLLWRQTTNGFGRFGWLASDFGLADSISADLTVSNGEQAYRFDLCRKNPAVREENVPEKRVELRASCSDVRKTWRLKFPEERGEDGNAIPGGKISMTLSLLTPFEIWDFGDEDRIFLAQENIADFAAWKTESGVKLALLKDLRDSETIFELSRDGRWTAPWLFLYREQDSKPLLVVFPRQPQRIEARVCFEVLEGFEITLGKAAEEKETENGAGVETGTRMANGAVVGKGTVAKNGAVAGIGKEGETEKSFDAESARSTSLVAGWPWGMARRNFPGDGAALSEETLEKIEWGVNQALCFPAERREYFALDPQNETVRLRMEVDFVRTPNDWNVDAKPFLCLPPLTAFMLELGRKGKLDVPMVKSREKLRDFDVPTPFGPMLGKAGTRIEWTLPLPADQDLLFVRIRDERLNALQNKLFLDGVKWTCGGRVPLDYFSLEFPMGKKCPKENISNFSWNFGMGSAWQGALQLNAEARKALERRTEIRTIEPVELCQPKAFTRHRSEPFSGLCYPVMFNSFYSNPTQYEPGFGSSVVYGDTNEATVLAEAPFQLLADARGMKELVRANWNYFRYVMRHQLFIDDYCFHAGSCREYGAGAWLDMLNAEYSGALIHARLAKLAGDEDEYAEAISRAAKKAIPTNARLFFNEWLEKIRPELQGKKYLTTGFSEEGAKVMTFPTRSGNFYAANDLFDFSQGIPGTQYPLYRKYAWKALQKYLSQTAFPALKELPTSPGYDYLAALGLYFDDLELVNGYAEEVFAEPKNQKSEDWPGIRHPFQIACVQWRNHHRLAISRFEGLNFSLAEYDPEKRLLSLKFQAENDSVLEIHSETAPRSAVRNGEKVGLLKSASAPDCWSLPLNEGENAWEIRF